MTMFLKSLKLQLVELEMDRFNLQLYLVDIIVQMLLILQPEGKISKDFGLIHLHGQLLDNLRQMQI